MKIVTYLKTAILAITITVLISCSSKDDEPSKPSISYSNNAIEATFQQSGSEMPTIDWNGDTGTLQLVESYSGGIPNLSFDTTTGEISWTKLLGEGIWLFDVEATNSAGTTTLEMSIDNTLQGTFTGAYDSTHYFQIIFNKNHTVLIHANNETSSGTWTISNTGVVIVNYTYDSGGEYSTKGNLQRSEDAVIYSGNWYVGFDALDANLGGTFNIELE